MLFLSSFAAFYGASFRGKALSVPDSCRDDLSRLSSPSIGPTSNDTPVDLNNGLYNGNGGELPLSSRPDSWRGSRGKRGEPEEMVGRGEERFKVVHFVRHGEGYHNVGYESLEDACLTSRGWKDAEGLRQFIKALPEPLKVQTVFVSPLTRTLETAVGVFGGPPWSEGSELPLLMEGQSHIPRKRSAHAAVAALPALPFVAVEECRERMSANRCDRHKALHLTRAHFPGVDFSLIRHDDDVLWDEYHDQAVNKGAKGSRYFIGEKTPQVVARGTKFVTWLMKRPESDMAVVTHSQFLKATLTALAEDCEPSVAAELKRGWKHCEMRSVVFNEEGTPVNVVEATKYPGGATRLYLFPINWAVEQGRRTLGRFSGAGRKVEPVEGGVTTRD